MWIFHVLNHFLKCIRLSKDFFGTAIGDDIK